MPTGIPAEPVATNLICCFEATFLSLITTLVDQPYGLAQSSPFPLKWNRAGRTVLAGSTLLLYATQEQEPHTLEFVFGRYSIFYSIAMKLIMQQYSSSQWLYQGLDSVFPKIERECSSTPLPSLQDSVLCADAALQKGLLSMLIETISERKTGVLACTMWKGAYKYVTTESLRIF